MSNLNSVVLQGRLTDNPTIHGAEQNVARFTLAVNDGFGEKEEVSFIDCVAFGKQVPVIGKHLVKGKQIVVRGKIVQNRWETPEGGKRSKLEVRLENFEGFYFIGQNKTGEAASTTPEEPVAAEVTKGEKLF